MIWRFYFRSSERQATAWEFQFLNNKPQTLGVWLNCKVWGMAETWKCVQMFSPPICLPAKAYFCVTNCVEWAGCFYRSGIASEFDQKHRFKIIEPDADCSFAAVNLNLLIICVEFSRLTHQNVILESVLKLFVPPLGHPPCQKVLHLHQETWYLVSAGFITQTHLTCWLIEIHSFSKMRVVKLTWPRWTLLSPFSFRTP